MDQVESTILKAILVKMLQGPGEILDLMVHISLSGRVSRPPDRLIAKI